MRREEGYSRVTPLRVLYRARRRGAGHPHELEDRDHRSVLDPPAGREAGHRESCLQSLGSFLIDDRYPSQTWLSPLVDVQFFLHQPRPYASFHGASQELTPTADAARASSRRLGSVSLEAEAGKLNEAMRGLLEAPDTSIAAHFLPVMRQILRSLCGGTGQVLPSWADPLALPTLRVSSFVTLLHTFQKLTSGVLTIPVDERDFLVLRAYAELVFDEDHTGVVRCV